MYVFCSVKTSHHICDANCGLFSGAPRRVSLNCRSLRMDMSRLLSICFTDMGMLERRAECFSNLILMKISESCFSHLFYMGWDISDKEPINEMFLVAILKMNYFFFTKSFEISLCLFYCKCCVTICVISTLQYRYLIFSPCHEIRCVILPCHSDRNMTEYIAYAAGLKNMDMFLSYKP